MTWFMYLSHCGLYLSHSMSFNFGVWKSPPCILPLFGITNVLVVALVCSCVGSFSLFF